MSIYTRTGDTGTTALFGGKRVLKSEQLVDVYGSIDELNSWVGYISSELATPDVQQFLTLIQLDLFTIGSTLAGWKGDISMIAPRVKEMESRIDLLEKELPSIRNFILPGGSPLGAYTHITRAICRRVERQIVALSQKQYIDPIIVKYLNRLSDLFFMLARFINNKAGKKETLWSRLVGGQAGKNTSKAKK